MASIYPHKQTVLIMIVCAIAVGGAYMYTKQSSSTAKTSVISPISVTNESEKPSAIATSTDWQLSFLDKSTTSTPEKTANTVQNQELTLTDRFGRDFFARYIQLRQSNLIENQQFVTDTLNQSIYTAARGAKQPKTYSLSDLSVIPNPDSARIRAYGNSLGSIFSTYTVNADPAIIANDAFEKGDMTMLEQIDPIISAYASIASALRDLPVPQPLTTYHLNLLNAISGMEKISRDIRAIESDPMQSIVSISAYAETQSSIVAQLKSMASYFSFVGISFSPSEPGSLFSLSS